MLDCLNLISNWVENNSGQIQILIAIVALYYVFYQIKLFQKQRYFELRLQLNDFIYENLNVVKEIKLKILKIKIFKKYTSNLTNYDRKMLEEFLEISDSTEETLSEIKDCLDIMLASVNHECDVFTINELEIELKETMGRIREMRDFHDKYDKLIVLLNKDNPL